MMDTHALAISAAQPGTVFLANRLGLFRSDDKGESWSDMEIGRFSPLTYARDVKVFPHDTQTLLGALSIAAVSGRRALSQRRSEERPGRALTTTSASTAP